MECYFEKKCKKILHPEGISKVYEVSSIIYDNYDFAYKSLRKTVIYELTLLICFKLKSDCLIENITSKWFLKEVELLEFIRYEFNI